MIGSLFVAGYSAEPRLAEIWQQRKYHWRAERGWLDVPKAAGGKTPSDACLSSKKTAENPGLTQWSLLLNGGDAGARALPDHQRCPWGE